ncbi:ketosteroid isomerase [Sphingomonas prati]|nr:ketosteroid isomerase [Sphingomonas prati]
MTRALLSAALMVMALPGAATAQPTAQTTHDSNKATVRRAFDAWAAGGTDFFDILADDVVWTIQGSGPNAKTYRSKAELVEKALAPFGARVSVPLKPTVRSMYADGDEVITVFDGVAQTNDGKPYRNTYAWFFTMRDGKVVTARAFLDLPAYDAVLRNVRPAARR